LYTYKETTVYSRAVLALTYIHNMQVTCIGGKYIKSDFVIDVFL